jgi:hypothetical protein
MLTYQIAKAAVLLEDGYGWREKDVWSELHRHSTLTSARAGRGVQRVILDLLDDDEAYGGGVLISWLSDATRLASGGHKFASQEATIASFALCMLFAHRERIGVPRLFEDVLKAERPGWDSLLQALAAEEADALMAWLESLDPAYAANRLDWTIHLWRAAIDALRQRDDREVLRRASRALSALISHLDSGGLGRLTSVIVDYGLAVPEVLSLIRTAAAAGALDPLNLATAFIKGHLSLEEALGLAGEKDRDRLIWWLADSWKPEEDRPPLGELIALLRQTRDWRAGLPERRTHFEMLLYQPDLEAARGSGLCDAVDEQLALPTEALRVMTFVAFTAERCSLGQAAFRVWLAERLLPKLGPAELSVALGDVARMEACAYQRYREVGLHIARAADDALILSVCGDLMNPPRIENLAELVAAWLQTAPRSGTHARSLSE